jgi:hypothetical protein
VSRIGTRELIYINPKGTAMRRVTRLLAEFTDGCPAAQGLEAAEARLDGAAIDLTE